MHPIALLSDTARSWGIALTDAQLACFTRYTSELQTWNAHMNLTSITDDVGIVTRHYLDSLRCSLAWYAPPDTLVDVGSGAGFPGIPLKIIVPSMRLTLLEATGKKTRFLEHLVQVLDLEQVTILHARAEDAAHLPTQRGRYDVAVARAVASLATLAEYCLPFLRLGGEMLAPKGAAIDEEIAAAKRAVAMLGGGNMRCETVALPGVDPRSLVCITKLAPTPTRYPRHAGVPARQPLG
jgi:16S rRNA (guanine527-N7)-methyltransferase